MSKEERDVGEILDSLIDSSTQDQLELILLVEALAEKLNRRQVLIVRLLLLNTSQTEIAKILGYSAPTINLDIKKVKEVLVELLKKDGKDYSNKLYKKLKIEAKKQTSKDVFNLEEEKPQNGHKGIKSQREKKTNS